MKEHFCSVEKSMITYQGKCNWCGESEGSMTQEALKLVMDALDDLLYWDNGKPEYDEARKALQVGKQALAQTQEPFAWADLQKEAQQIIESKFLWKQFIDGTPLANDIACWMADFARQYTTPPQD